MVRIKRAYEPAQTTDGHRVLVDRLWPRGVRKDDAHIEDWLKEVAPSDALRRWFGHDRSRFNEFRERYRRELQSPRAREAVEQLARLSKKEPVTLVYSARDDEHNNAVVLAEEIARHRVRRHSDRTMG